MQQGNTIIIQPLAPNSNSSSNIYEPLVSNKAIIAATTCSKPEDKPKKKDSAEKRALAGANQIVIAQRVLRAEKALAMQREITEGYGGEAGLDQLDEEIKKVVPLLVSNNIDEFIKIAKK